MRKILLSILALFCIFVSHAQLSGTKTIPGDYPTIKDAVTALNAAGVGAGGVTFNVLAGHTESSTDSIMLTATGTSSDPIVFQKSGSGANPVVTRTGAGLIATSTLGASGDAVIIIEGSDFVTFNGIDVTSANAGIEYGYFLRKVSATDAPKNITIQNGTVTMTKGTSQYVVGIIVSNLLRGGSISSATGVTVTSTGGRTENITITGNTITNTFTAIYMRGYAASTPYDLYDQNFTIGTAAAPNNIINFAGNATATAYGIYNIYGNNLNINNNTINNLSGGGTAATGLLYGVFLSTGTNSSFSLGKNLVNLTSSSTSSSLYGLYNSAFSGAGSYTENSITLNATATTSGTYGYIYNTNTLSATNILSNTFVGTTLPVTGSTYLIYNNQSSTNLIAVRNNIISGTINRTGASGTFYGYYNNGSPTGVEEVSNNNFSNVTLTGTSAFIGVNITTAAGSTQNIFGNTISNITSGSGTSQGMNLTIANTRNVYNNVIHTFSGTGTVTGIATGSGFTSGGIYKNKIYNLTGLTASGVVYGISIVSGTSPLVYNNLIGDLKAPAASAADAIRGISITSTLASSTIKVYYNTIHIAASSTGANFGTSGIFHTASATGTTAALDLRNNIISNQSTPAGTGLTVAFRRSGTALNNYAATSNNNLYYAGTPSATRLIYYDGTNSDQTLSTFQARVAPADAASITVAPVFISTNGADATFLHINTTTPTRIEGGAQPIAGITDDYDGDVRNASTPDIGADEFAGTPQTGCSGAPAAGTITGTNTVCTGSSRTLTLNGHSADVGVTYQWKSATTPGGPYTVIAGATGAAYNTGNLTSARYYVVDVTCTNTAQTVTTTEFGVTVNPLPVITITPAAPAVCLGASTTLTASGASTYTWSPATNLSATTGATVTATPTVTRTYTVTGTDANGCVNTAMVTVTVNPAVTAAATATPANICLNGSSQLQATTPSISYSGSVIPHSPLTSTSGATTLVSGGTAIVPLTNGTLDDGRWEKIPLPFTFRYYGVNYDSINISTNGFATFGVLTNSSGFNVTLPNTGTPNNAIHLVSADLDFRSPATGTIEYFVEGTAPNRTFIINFVDASFYDATTSSNPGTASVQAIFYEGSNNIEIHTTDISNTTVNKAQGIENADGTAGVVVPGRNNTATWTGVPNAYRFSVNPVTYSWSPATFLNNPNIANPVASNVTATTTYTVTVTDAVTGCAGTASVTVTAGTPLSVVASNTNSNLCIGGSATMNAVATGGGLPYTYSWSDGTSVVSTSQNFTASPTVNTTYTVTVTDACGNTSTATTTVNVNNPVITSVTGATRCGIGTVDLSATTAAGTINWYTVATGGAPVGTGTTFTTPTISATTTYYAGASNGGSNINTGRIVPQAGGATILTTYGQDFTVTSTIVLNAVDVISTTGTSITISLFNASGSTQLQTTGARTVAPNSTTAITLGWTIAPGTYRLVANGMTGNFIRENSTVTYPIALGNVGQINGFVSSITGTVSTSSSYYFMYNWNMFVPCEGPRMAVTATVNTPPAITVSATNTTICKGQSTTLNVTSPNAGYTYTWTPGSLSGASVPVSPTATTKYYVNANDVSGGANNLCAAVDSIVITVNELPGVFTVDASATAVCPGGVVTLTPVATNSGTITIGTGTSTNTTSTPYKGFFGGQKVQLLYTAAELSALGLQAGASINEIGFNIAAFTSPYTFNDFTIAMKLTMETSLTSSFQTGMTTVFGPTNYTLTGTAPFTVTHILNTPFTWDGISNILVETCFNNNNGGGVSGNSASVYSTTATGTKTAYYSSDNNATLCSAPGSATTSTTRPNINLGYNNNITYSWSPAATLFIDAAATVPYTGGPAAVVYAKPTTATTYTATATNTLGCTQTATVSLTMNTVPAINTQPAAVTVCEGSTATMNVGATGTGLTYQWQKGGVNIAGATADTYSIATTTAADAGQYTVVVSGTCAPSVTSNAVALTINTAPAIVSMSADTTICSATNLTLSVNATGTGLMYQWRQAGVNIAGATSSSYTITNATAANAGAYDVIVSGTCAPAVTSVTTNVTIVPAASITTQPATQAICPGSPVTFSVTAANASSYQWQKDGVNIAGATAATYTIASVAAADAATYTVIVSGNTPCGTVTSSGAVLTLNSIPAITTQPAAQTICSNNPVTFTVVATGTGLTYQWRKDGVLIAGATSASYTIASVAAANAGNYDVIVSGTCAPSVTSAPATLTVNGSPVINTQPSAVNVCPGAPATFTVNASGSGLTYQWRRNGVNIAGATSATYTIAAAAQANAGNYDVVITSSCATTTTSAAVALTVFAQPAIATQPVSQTVCFNNSVTFTVAATGNGLTYQWRKAGAPIAGATSSTFTISNVTTADLGSYDVVVSGTCTPPVTSNAATLSISNSNTWLGTLNSNWSNPGNWCGGVPTSTMDVLIPSGTTFPAILNADGDVNSLTIQSGATFTIAAGGTLNVYGNLANSGTITATNGHVAFRGATAQTTTALNAGFITMNGAGGLTLNGAMTAGSLVLTNGNITLGNNNLVIGGNTQGSVVSHLITNGTGVVTINGIGTNAAIFPVGPDATSYNPVMIANGSNRNFSVSVKTGVTPAINQVTRAINRTWVIVPATASATPASISFGYADAHANAAANPAGLMEVGAHNGTAWSVVSPAIGVTPTGTATARMATVTTTSFGAMVVANTGAVLGTTATPRLDADITSSVLMPNMVAQSTTLRIQSRRAEMITWTVTDAAGRLVMTITRPVQAGQTDIRLSLGHLANGTYQLNGFTSKGKLGTLRFIRY